MYKVKVFIQDKELQYEFSTLWALSAFVRIANFAVRLLWGGLTKRAVDAAYACEDCGSVDPQVHYSNCPLANTRRN